MKRFQENKNLQYLFLVFILSVLIRLFQLSDFPVGFHVDEASLGYNGYSILKTGKDDNGNFLPLYIDMFGDNRPSGYHYLTILPILFFGLNEFATRLPGVIFGSLSVFAFYFFIFSLSKNSKLALLGSLLLSISPWHFVLSRASGEAIVSLFFIFLGFGFIFKGNQDKKLRFMVLGFFVAALSFLFYHTSRVFVPMFLAAYFLFFIFPDKNYLKNYKYIFIISFFAMILFIAILIFAVPGGSGRFSQVNIFSSFETKFLLEKQASEDALAWGNIFISKIFHNKITNLFLIFIGNYLEYFSGSFLFIKGGLPVWYQVPRMGMLYLVELPFILYGLYLSIRNKDTYGKVLLLFLLLSPVVAGITNDDIPNINRASVMFPVLNIFSALGILGAVCLFSGKKKKIFLYAIIAAFIFNFSYFTHQYFINSKISDPWYRNNGFSSLIDTLRNDYSDTEKIIFTKSTGGVYPLILFYMKYDPSTYHKEGSPKDADMKGFGRFFFVPQDCPSVQINPKIPQVKNKIFVDKGNCPFDKILNVRRHSFILREDGTKAYRILYEKKINAK